MLGGGNKFFQPGQGPRTERSTEDPKPVPKPKPSDADWLEKQRNRYVKERRKFLRKKFDDGILTQEQYQGALNALYITHTSLEWQQVMEKFKNGLQMEFVRWLNGESDYNLDKKKTPWGTHRLVGPGINEYLTEFINNKSEFSKEIAVLKATIPSNITEAWKYFRYIVIGDKNPDADFLADFNTIVPYASSDEIKSAKAALRNKASKADPKQNARWQRSEFKSGNPYQAGRPLRDWDQNTMMASAVYDDEDRGGSGTPLIQNDIGRVLVPESPPSRNQNPDIQTAVNRALNDLIRENNRQFVPESPQRETEDVEMIENFRGTIEGVLARNSQETNQALQNLTSKFDAFLNMMAQSMEKKGQKQPQILNQQFVTQAPPPPPAPSPAQPINVHADFSSVSQAITEAFNRHMQIERRDDETVKVAIDTMLKSFNEVTQQNAQQIASMNRELQTVHKQIAEASNLARQNLSISQLEIEKIKKENIANLDAITKKLSMITPGASQNIDIQTMLETQHAQNRFLIEDLFNKAQLQKEQFIAALQQANKNRDPDQALATLIQSGFASNNEQLTNALVNFEKTNKGLYNEFAKLASDTTTKIAQIKSEQFGQLLEESNRKTAALEAELNRVRGSFDSLKQKSEQDAQQIMKIQEMENKYNEATKSFQNLNAQLQSTQTELAQAKQAQQRLHDQMTQANAKITELQSTDQNEINRLRGENDRRGEEIKNLQGTIQQLNFNQEQLRGQMQQSEQTATAQQNLLQSTLAQQSNVIVNTLRGEISGLQNQLAIQTQERFQLAEAQKTISNLVSEGFKVQADTLQTANIVAKRLRDLKSVFEFQTPQITTSFFNVEQLEETRPLALPAPEIEEITEEEEVPLLILPKRQEKEQRLKLKKIVTREDTTKERAKKSLEKAKARARQVRETERDFEDVPIEGLTKALETGEGKQKEKPPSREELQINKQAAKRALKNAVRTRLKNLFLQSRKKFDTTAEQASAEVLQKQKPLPANIQQAMTQVVVAEEQRALEESAKELSDVAFESITKQKKKQNQTETIAGEILSASQLLEITNMNDEKLIEMLPDLKDVLESKAGVEFMKKFSKIMKSVSAAARLEALKGQESQDVEVLKQKIKSGLHDTGLFEERIIDNEPELQDFLKDVINTDIVDKPRDFAEFQESFKKKSLELPEVSTSQFTDIVNEALQLSHKVKSQMFDLEEGAAHLAKESKDIPGLPSGTSKQLGNDFLDAFANLRKGKLPFAGLAMRKDIIMDTRFSSIEATGFNVGEAQAFLREVDTLINQIKMKRSQKRAGIMNFAPQAQMILA